MKTSIELQSFDYQSIEFLVLIPWVYNINPFRVYIPCIYNSNHLGLTCPWVYNTFGLNHGQLWSITMVNHGQPWSTMVNNHGHIVTKTISWSNVTLSQPGSTMVIHYPTLHCDKRCLNMNINHGQPYSNITL